jgi:hypothetical protein
MTQRRLRQANLFGPAGFVSVDDGEVIELSQKGFEQKPFHRRKPSEVIPSGSKAGGSSSRSTDAPARSRVPGM